MHIEQSEIMHLFSSTGREEVIPEPSRQAKLLYNLIQHAPQHVTQDYKVSLIKMTRTLLDTNLHQAKAFVEDALDSSTEPTPNPFEATPY